MGTAAAVIIRKEKELVAHFRSAGAVTPATAQSPDALGVDTRMAWLMLTRRAVIREATPGQFYLDEVAWGALEAKRRNLLLIVVAVLLVLGAIVFVAGTSLIPGR